VVSKKIKSIIKKIDEKLSGKLLMLSLPTLIDDILVNAQYHL